MLHYRATHRYEGLLDLGSHRAPRDNGGDAPLLAIQRLQVVHLGRSPPPRPARRATTNVYAARAAAPTATRPAVVVPASCARARAGPSLLLGRWPGGMSTLRALLLLPAVLVACRLDPGAATSQCNLTASSDAAVQTTCDDFVRPSASHMLHH